MQIKRFYFVTCYKFVFRFMIFYSFRTLKHLKISFSFIQFTSGHKRSFVIIDLCIKIYILSISYKLTFKKKSKFKIVELFNFFLFAFYLHFLDYKFKRINYLFALHLHFLDDKFKRINYSYIWFYLNYFYFFKKNKSTISKRVNMKNNIQFIS